MTRAQSNHCVTPTPDLLLVQHFKETTPVVAQRAARNYNTSPPTHESINTHPTAECTLAHLRHWGRCDALRAHHVPTASRGDTIRVNLPGFLGRHSPAREKSGRLLARDQRATTEFCSSRARNGPWRGGSVASRQASWRLRRIPTAPAIHFWPPVTPQRRQPILIDKRHKAE